jgi:hypothetical protein
MVVQQKSIVDFHEGFTDTVKASDWVVSDRGERFGKKKALIGPKNGE